MAKKSRISLFVETMSISISLMVFSFFVHFEYPFRLFSFAALLFSAFMISRNVKTVKDLKKIVGENLNTRPVIKYTVSGIIAGTVLAVFYRWNVNQTFYPDAVHLFVVIAALVGCMEELIFRGFLQTMVESINGVFSIVFSTISHTGYKCLLFMAPAVSGNINSELLFFWTFGVGLLFGTIRHYSKSVIIPLAAHVFFDVLVYAEYYYSPWWVW